MAQRSTTSTLPRRDRDGRVLSLSQLLRTALAYTVLNGVGLVVIDAILAVLGLSGFGHSTGWLVLILPSMLYFDELRAWRGRGVRFAVAVVGALVALAAGLLAAGLVRGLPPIVSGSAGAVVAVVVYAPVWFLGIRWLTGERPHSESP